LFLSVQNLCELALWWRAGQFQHNNFRHRTDILMEKHRTRKGCTSEMLGMLWPCSWRPCSLPLPYLWPVVVVVVIVDIAAAASPLPVVAAIAVVVAELSAGSMFALLGTKVVAQTSRSQLLPHADRAILGKEETKEIYNTRLGFGLHIIPTCLVNRKSFLNECALTRPRAALAIVRVPACLPAGVTHQGWSDGPLLFPAGVARAVGALGSQDPAEGLRFIADLSEALFHVAVRAAADGGGGGGGDEAEVPADPAALMSLREPGHTVSWRSARGGGGAGVPGSKEEGRPAAAAAPP
jgi:hypothetical protein